jgi:hypothetical protein
MVLRCFVDFTIPTLVFWFFDHFLSSVKEFILDR